MKKYRILVVPSDRFGVGMYRSLTPHIELEKKYPNEFKIDIDYNPPLESDEFLKKYDLIHYHKTLGKWEEHDNLLNRLDSLGVKTIMDIDDHWSPGQHHPGYKMIKQHELDKKGLNNLKSARNITTTTSVFADILTPINKNVFIVPNAINDKDKQFISNSEKSEKVRFGWLGGSAHLDDIKILRGVTNQLKSDGLLDKTQFVLCGFDLRGKVTEIDPQTGQPRQRNKKPTEVVWYEYERIFTDDYKTISDDYKKHLQQFREGDYSNVDDEPYKRVWTKSISSYASGYNNFDVSLAPLVENTFNKCKSQLKTIEAGIHKKGLIAQDFAPYQIDGVNLIEKGGKINENGNCILIESRKNHKDWYKNIKKLIKEPELIDIMGGNLYNVVKNNYTLDVVTDTRRETYLKILEE